jgi:hypothetical protein
VYDAEDTSAKPKPLYIIGPGYANLYSRLAVDASGNLFVAGGGGDYGTEVLYMFPPGAKKPSATCPFSNSFGGMFVANGKLYLSTLGYSNTIAEYAEPLQAGGGCGKPIRTLTDKAAFKLHAAGLVGLLVDQQENIFDSFALYVGSPPQFIDEFKAGSRSAQNFAKIQEGGTPEFFAVDRNDDIITTGSEQGYSGNALAVFPRESKQQTLYDPLDGAVWEWDGLALDKAQTTLFAATFGNKSAIHLLAFDPKTGKIGKEKRTFGNVELGGGAIALYAR